MTIACVIPARYQSVRFPGKLLARAYGKTVLQRTFEKAARCPEIDALFVATDDERIAEHVQKLNGEVIWTSSSCQNGTERIGEALQNNNRLQRSSYIINLQGDHPCTEPHTMSKIIRILQSDPKSPMSTAVTPIESRDDYLSSHIVKCVFDQQANALYFSRSPIPYIPPQKTLIAYAHIGIYCYRTPFLKELLHKKMTPLQMYEDLEQLNALENGHKIKVAIVKEKSMGIDTPSDLEKLKKYLHLSRELSPDITNADILRL